MEFTLITEDRRCGGTVGTQPNHDNWTATPYLGGLIKEFHDVATDTWIESATQEEVSAIKTPIYQNKLVECVKHLRDRALVSSISKEEDVTYLKDQAEAYRNKYVIANRYCNDGTFDLNDDWAKAIINEMNNTNIVRQLIGTIDELTIPIFMNLIKLAFEKGLERSNKFNPSIEIFRCKAKDLYLVGQYERCDQMIEYAYNLPMQMELTEVDGFINHINQI